MCARRTGYASLCLELKHMLKHTFDYYAPILCPSNDKKEREVREGRHLDERKPIEHKGTNGRSGLDKDSSQAH